MSKVKAMPEGEGMSKKTESEPIISSVEIVSVLNLSWTKQTRLAHAVKTGKIKDGYTLKQWEKILAEKI